MRETTKQWLSFANDDLDAIGRIGDAKHLTNIIAFHAQQYIEKSFKAVLEEYGINIPRIHDLITLYDLVKELINGGFDEDLLDVMNKVYIEARYPPEIGLPPLW